MDTYSTLREIADSWVLLAMFAFFLGAAVWALWPSRRATIHDAAHIVMRDACDAPLPNVTKPAEGTQND